MRGSEEQLEVTFEVTGYVITCGTVFQFSYYSQPTEMLNTTDNNMDDTIIDVIIDADLGVQV